VTEISCVALIRAGLCMVTHQSQ